MAKSTINAVIQFVSKGRQNVSGDSKKIEDSVRSVSDVVDSLNKKIKAIGVGVAYQSTVSAIQTIGSSFSALKSTVAGVSGAFMNFISANANAGDRISKFSRLVGMSAGELMKVRSAGMDAGMSVESIDAAMQRFSISTGKAAGGIKANLDVFNALGVRIRDANGNVKGQTQLLMEVSDAYKKLRSEADRNRVSQELFGRSGVQMSELLSGGSASLRRQFSAADARGFVMTDKMAADAEKFTHNLQFAQEAVGGISQRIAYAILPKVNTLLDKFTTFVTVHRAEIDHISDAVSGEISNVVSFITDKMPSILSFVVQTAGAVKDFVVSNKEIVAAVSAVVAFGGPILTALVSAKVAISAISAFVSGPIVGGIALAVVGVTAWASAINSVVKNWGLVKSVVSDTWESVKGYMSYVGDFWAGVFEKAYEGWNGFKSFVLNGAADILSTLSGIPIIGDKFTSAAEYLRSFNESQTSSPNSAAVAKSYSESKSVSTNRLEVSFSGLPYGSSITPSKNFDYGVIDYSAGYAFGSNL